MLLGIVSHIVGEQNCTLMAWLLEPVATEKKARSGDTMKEVRYWFSLVANGVWQEIVSGSPYHSACFAFVLAMLWRQSGAGCVILAPRLGDIRCSSFNPCDITDISA